MILYTGCWINYSVSNMHPFIRRVGYTYKLQQSPILVVRNCMYNCCHEIGIKPSMYTYILYEWCVFNWYPDVTLM